MGGFQSPDTESQPDSSPVKVEYEAQCVESEVDQSTKLKRGLPARAVTMIALGGAIGTGLIIGTYGNPRRKTTTTRCCMQAC